MKRGPDSCFIIIMWHDGMINLLASFDTVFVFPSGVCSGGGPVSSEQLNTEQTSEPSEPGEPEPHRTVKMHLFRYVTFFSSQFVR